MQGKMYSQRLGVLTDAQFQAALDHFHYGHFIQAESIPFGLFGQNIFISSTTGEYVLRGDPHFWWQFPTEQFFARQLHERTSVPVPWPYLIDPTPDIFGWSYVIMPRLYGLQLADPQVRAQLNLADKRKIARALGENLARMQAVTWPISGRYNPATGNVDPFDVAFELAHPFPVASDARLAGLPPTTISYSDRVKACLRHHLLNAQESNALTTTPDDVSWVEERLTSAHDALNDTFEPCLLMEDYKEGNLVVEHQGERWQVSGVFDLMEAHFGDGEADLARQFAEYFVEDASLAQTFLDSYRTHKPLRPGFAARFPIYLLLDRAIIWAYFQRQGQYWWEKQWTFREWVSQYLPPHDMLEQR